jgi:hypothetical protein
MKDERDWLWRLAALRLRWPQSFFKIPALCCPADDTFEMKNNL